MHRKLPTTLDTAARVLHARDGKSYPLGLVARGAEALYWDREPPGVWQFSRAESWLLPTQGWLVNRLTDRPGHVREVPFDWYIDLDQITVEGDCWTVADGLLDLIVVEGVRGTLLDADEFADDLADGMLSRTEGAYILRSLHALYAALARHTWSVAALLAEYAPDLPR